MAITGALPEFNYLGRSVTFTFLQKQIQNYLHIVQKRAKINVGS